MGNYLYALNLDFLEEEENTIKGLVGHVLQEGKAVTGYYGLPYFNMHFGGTQIIDRVTRDKETGNLAFSGFDTHADSLCAWKMRIVSKRETDEEDPTCVHLLLKGMDRKGLFPVDVVNGDILPSFKQDEVIDLQMVAFSDQADFFDNEEAYEESVPAVSNGKKMMIGENTIFPIGIFSDNENIKDIVQIHGTIKKLKLGASKFGEENVGIFLRCHVDTQMGEIVIFMPLRDVDKYKSGYYKEGKVINCYGYLSGDAAIYNYENGVIHDAENNLKLVAYTLENGDPKRLRSALAENFVYHSENAGKHFEDIDEYLKFVQAVHDGSEVAHTQYATITSIDEGPELEYPVGTRCAVISYESEEGFNSIIFVDTDDEGRISRIYLSREGRYHFKLDNPFPEEENFAEMIAKSTYRTSIIGRAHFHSLIDDELKEDAIDQFVSDHKEELESGLSDLLTHGISEEVFAEAFLRGVKKSKIPDFDEEDMKDIGKQFYKDATLFKSEEEQKNIFHDALVLTAAIGRLYIGRADREREA